MNGGEALAAALRMVAAAVYAVPGYPVTGVAATAGAVVCANEKVALEYAIGDSLAGRRAAVIVKNVGMNLLADPLVQATAQGLIAGVVVVAGDDPLCRASQAAEDSRHFGTLAMVPVVEPEPDVFAAVGEGFALSERLSRVAILRVTPDTLDATVPAEPVLPAPAPGSLAPGSFTMRGRGERALAAAASAVSPDIPGVRVTLPAVRALVWAPERFADRGFFRSFCPHCPYRPLFALLAEREMRAACDAGCSLLAMNQPYGIGVASYGLGSAVAVGAKSTGVALIGDYALMHSGINALIDVYEKETPLLCIVLANRRMGMVGGHEVPDVLRYIGWADPVVCDADDDAALKRLIAPAGRPITVVVRGVCPDGESHERVEC
ncbi:MAG: indolepyruvate ferredoxin oxidoreductase, alpha subunit [Methanofollis sp.]|nr:indolepyruvate ferredoxin oxidoreductase, alpha subunit [Methanofollis sp.]